MKLYHSSNVSVIKPDIIYSRDYLDFGKGFYLTSIHEQAVRYGQRFIRRQREAWLNAYEFEFNSSEWKILELDSYDKITLTIIIAPGTMVNHYTDCNNINHSEATRKLHRQEIP